MNKEQHLESVLKTHKMSHIDEKIKKYRSRRDEIRDALIKTYGSNLYTIINSGSCGKDTAINTKFDLDIVVPFKRDSFSSISLMFDEVFDFLTEKYKDEANVKKQKVSIGVFFYADEDGDKIDIDVVPGREVNEDSYNDSKDLNIYFNENHWGFKKGTYTKTNIQTQIDHIRGTGDSKNDVRKIIRLLKIWKTTNSKQYKSFFLELITIKVFDRESITGNIWDKLKSVMEYIKDNVTKDNFTLIDPGNSNNDVANTLESWEKTILSNEMSTILDRIEKNSENIKSYFPINEEFEENDIKTRKNEALNIATSGVIRKPWYR